MKYLKMIYANPANRDLFPDGWRPEVLAEQEAPRQVSHHCGEPLDVPGPDRVARDSPQDEEAV
ncbi:hypothetical protein SNE510_60700 [Streptomyces sp. NE5-10]|uniref:hypothetical protein n=1 Tax=Streptomyces sp. NE5-10 TaxID=2759674 RepID=UPI001908D986|nr:hypothetical protein [Streptomyces sp. NE5-10]GHJ96551.1 hypothetical protein SNE510_60700 [Streptomyces sp. NE5-10]